MGDKIKFFVIGLLFVNFSSGIFLQKSASKWYNGRSEFMQQQRKIYALFRHIYSPEWNPTISEIGKTFEVFNPEYYKDLEIVNGFLKLYLFGFLPKSAVFSVADEKSLIEAKALVSVLKTTIDLKTALKVSAWAKYHMNEEMFLYSTLIYFIHYSEEEFDFPALYEINPYKFFSPDAVNEAQKVKQQGIKWTKSATIESAKFHSENSHSLSYFTDDYELNAYYYYLHLSYPYWMNETLNLDRRGEVFLHEHQQLLARYNLERISNGIPEIEAFDYDFKFPVNHQPMLRNANGYQMAARSCDFVLKSRTNRANLKMMESRILDGIERGSLQLRNGQEIDFTLPSSVNDLGNLLEGNVNSSDSTLIKEYFTKLKSALGEGSPDKMSSPMRHFETNLRDPGFYYLIRKMLNLNDRYQELLPSYQYQDLVYDEVNITSVRISEMETYFIDHDVDITNAVYMEQPAPVHQNNTPNSTEGYWHKRDEVNIKYRSKILTHLPFSYDLKIEWNGKTMAKTSTAIVRAFIGPAPQNDFKNIDWNEIRNAFFQIDYFKLNLRPGVNNIRRKSTQFNGFSSKPVQFAEVEALNNENDPYEVNNEHAFCGFPLRLMLPRSNVDGKKFMFYFIVSPFKGFEMEAEPAKKCKVGGGNRKFDLRPLGFPFDRPIANSKDFLVPNSAFRKSIIIQKIDNNVVIPPVSNY